MGTVQHTIGGQPPNQKRYASFSREAFGEGDPQFKATLLPIQERLFQEVQRVKAELREAKPKYEHRANDYRALVEEKQGEVAAWYYTAAEAMRAGIEAQLGKAAEAWKKGREPIRELLNLQRLQARYGSMSKAELEAAISIGQDGQPAKLLENQAHDPDEIDIALQAASHAGVSPAIIDSFKKVAERGRYREPWLREGENPQLLKLHKLLDAKYGKVNVLADAGMGEADILGPEGLFDDSPIDKPAEGESK